MLAILLLLPAVAAAVSWMLRSDRARVQLFRAEAVMHLLLVLLIWQRAPAPLGTVFLAVAAADASGETTLFLPDLLGRARAKPWLHASFVLLLIGYGTKMGLAPMHAWKPDAYGEAPPPVAGLLAGAVTAV